MSEINVLDVTQIEPRLKHPTIFEHFEALQEGEAFVIHNDHDPKPLYYQLLSENGDIFTWEYLEEGPQWWKVKIAKKVLSAQEETIGDIAAKDPRNAEIFRKYGLEFCCDGKKPLKEACRDAGVSIDTVSRELANLPPDRVAPDRDFNHWDLDFLADYIVNIHHRYVKSSIPMLRDLSEKIAAHHGAAHPELYEIKEHVDALLSEIQEHGTKEENVLFPFIRQMVQSKRDGTPLPSSDFDSVGTPVQMMMDDHDESGRHLYAIEQLSQNYLFPPDGCESYRLYYHKLQEFDDDLHQHIHLENNILFPKSVELEKTLSGQEA